MKLKHLILKISSLAFIIILITVIIFPQESQSASDVNLYSATATVSWNSGARIVKDSTYMFVRQEGTNFVFYNHNDEADLSFIADGCQSPKSGMFDVDTSMTGKLFDLYRLHNDSTLTDINSAEMKTAVATLTWGSGGVQERDCDYGYLHAPVTAETAYGGVEGDILSKGQINVSGLPVPYIAVRGSGHLVIAGGENNIKGYIDVNGKTVETTDITALGNYTVEPGSSTDFNIDGFATAIEKITTEFGTRFTSTDGDQNRLENEIKSNTDVWNTNGDIYVIDGDFTVNDPNLTIQSQAKKLVYVKGNLTIESNITKNSTTDKSALAFVVDGNITVNGDVKVSGPKVTKIEAGLIGVHHDQSKITEDNPYGWDSQIVFSAFNCLAPRFCGGGRPSASNKTLEIRGLVLGQTIRFDREPTLLLSSGGLRRYGVTIEYDKRVTEMPSLSTLVIPSFKEIKP